MKFVIILRHKKNHGDFTILFLCLMIWAGGCAPSHKKLQGENVVTGETAMTEMNSPRPTAKQNDSLGEDKINSLDDNHLKAMNLSDLQKQLEGEPSLQPQAQGDRLLAHLRFVYGLLSFYEKEIESEGLNRVIGLSRALENKEFSYVEALKQVTFNSYFAARLVTSYHLKDPFVDEILEDYKKSLELLRHRKGHVEKLIKVISSSLIENCSSGVEDSSHCESAPFSEGILSAALRANSDEEFKKLPLFKKLLVLTQSDIGVEGNRKKKWHEYYGVEDFDIVVAKKFIGQDRGWRFLEDLNLFNLYLLVRGPALVEKIFRSPLGHHLGKTFGVPHFIKRIGALKWPMNSMMMWLVLETADGCLIRYSYLALSFDLESGGGFKERLEDYLINR